MQIHEYLETRRPVGGTAGGGCDHAGRGQYSLGAFAVPGAGTGIAKPLVQAGGQQSERLVQGPLRGGGGDAVGPGGPARLPRHLKRQHGSGASRVLRASWHRLPSGHRGRGPRKQIAADAGLRCAVGPNSRVRLLSSGNHGGHGGAPRLGRGVGGGTRNQCLRLFATRHGRGGNHRS